MPQSGTSSHPAFNLVRAEEIDSLNIRVEQYEHQRTGAVHYHLAAESDENVFLVALRTVPEDSTGVAHILEHTALCGSEHYPVRDPFFMMLRRSLNTFMNAFTSSDWTAYPFASQNRKDFRNLLDVYLDAVFFSRLDPLDFAQEGHRVEFAEPDNPHSDLVFKGVVFNEMKGAMSSITSTLWNTLCAHLFPTSTYRHNSGGDPEHIPDLSYEELRAFYQSHYHPTNAIFMTFGDIGAEEHHAVFERNALSRFDRLDEEIRVQPEQRFSEPLRVTEAYALDDANSTENKTHIVMAWMLGESADLTQLLEAQLLASVLTDNSASPLQHLLETTDLGRSPSPLCGLEDSMREMVFCCGVEGSEAEHAEALEQAILDVIETVAREGLPLERLEAVLHQLELHQREISGDSYPYGLQLILQALGSATHYSDPIAVLNLDPVIGKLRQQIRNPDYIRDLARRLLLDNTHRLTLVMTPDTNLSTVRQQREIKRLAAIKSGMDETQTQHVMQLAADLVARQAQVDDESLLPKVGIDDVAAALPDLEYTQTRAGDIALTQYERGTNGLNYLQFIAPLPALDGDQLELLPLYSSLVTELGVGEADYMAMQERQASTVGAINAFSTLRGGIDDEQSVQGHFTLSSKALVRNAAQQAQMMMEVLNDVRFDETDRLRDLIGQLLARREQSVTANGHGLAMAAASAGMSPLAKLSHNQSGLAGIKALRQLNETLQSAAGRKQFSDHLSALHAAVNSRELCALAVGDDAGLASLQAAVNSVAADCGKRSENSALELAGVRERCGELWLTNSQVYFCARAYPTVPVQHPDAPALTVLGGFLRNGFLHRAIREQGGAYGGGASQDSSIAAFRFYSYRDPRCAETLSDFDQSVGWMIEATHEQRALEEAILGVISSIDKPSSPAGEAKQHYHNRLYGRTHEQREAFRQNILGVTLDDLRRVSETYLQNKQASTAIIAPAASGESLAELCAKESLQQRTL